MATATVPRMPGEINPTQREWRTGSPFPREGMPSDYHSPRGFSPPKGVKVKRTTTEEFVMTLPDFVRLFWSDQYRQMCEYRLVGGGRIYRARRFQGELKGDTFIGTLPQGLMGDQVAVELFEGFVVGTVAAMKRFKELERAEWSVKADIHAIFRRLEDVKGGA